MNCFWLFVLFWMNHWRPWAIPKVSKLDRQASADSLDPDNPKDAQQQN